MIDLSAHVLVLDLDDTLYLERDYARSGFAAVGSWAEAEHGVTGLAQACLDLFEDGVRGTIFDRALQALEVDDGIIQVATLVERYRTHRPAITLAEDATRLLRRARGLPSALITDGPLTCQSNKVAALDLPRRLGKVILTGALPQGCGKPHPMAFEQVEDWSGKPPSSHVYIADNLAKDFLAPRRRGWLTVQIARPGRIHQGEAPTAAHAAVHAIATLDEIWLR